MSSRELVPPSFAIPPEAYSQQYFSDVVRAFSLYVLQQQQPGEGRNTFTVFTELQSNDANLEIGAIFEVDGFVKITRASNPHPEGSAATGSVGTVTVVVP